MDLAQALKGFASTMLRSSKSLRHAFILLALTSLSICLSTLLDESDSGFATAAGPEQPQHKLSNRTAMITESFAAAVDAGGADFEQKDSSTKLSGGDLSTHAALKLERVDLDRIGNRVVLNEMPRFISQHRGRAVGLSKSNEYVFYSIDTDLQRFTDELVRKSDAPHVAIVAMEPRSGRILAISEKSSKIENLALHNGMPAASLFKIVTTAAALEANAVKPESVVRFRGGDYTLNKWNYLPDRKKDKRSMTVYEALGRSCNAVFGRIALGYLSPSVLRRYADNFGFNDSLGFEYEMPESTAVIPEDDFGLSRTAAGFGNVYVTPVHAAALVAGIANSGLLPRPRLIDQIVSPKGQVTYSARPEYLRRIVSGDTADRLLETMQSTTTVGTSKSEFFAKNKPLVPVPVAAKTGTLSGTNPKGVNHWFVAAAPIHDPKIALAVIVVNPGRARTKASRLGREVIQKYLF